MKRIVVFLLIGVFACSSSGNSGSRDVVEHKDGLIEVNLGDTSTNEVTGKEITGEVKEVGAEAVTEDILEDEGSPRDMGKEREGEEIGEDLPEEEVVSKDTVEEEGLEVAEEVAEDVEVTDDVESGEAEVEKDVIEEWEEEVIPPKRTGECHSSEDCYGQDCVRLSIGWHVCLGDTPQEFTECKPPKNSMDECCSSKDCDEGAGCYKTYPINYFGGAEPLEPFKICIADECHEDSDCVYSTNEGEKRPGICLPAGVNGWPKKRCVPNYCDAFGGCGPGEYCRVVPAPCNSRFYYGAFCASAKTCETDEDCSGGEQCVGDMNTGRTVCKFIHCPP